MAELSLSGPGKHARQGITFVGVEQLLAVGAKPGNPRHCTLHDCRCYKIRLSREREKERVAKRLVTQLWLDSLNVKLQFIHLAFIPQNTH